MADSQSSVGLEWPMDLFRRRGGVQTAAHELQATQFAVSDRERLLTADVRMQYGAAAAAVREVAVADDVVATAR
jgi:outer membrane protein TolC